jgi:hypothetical protein
VPIRFNRATSAYICVFTVFAVGVWLIIELGSIYLTPPRDISGTWRPRENPSASPIKTFSIDQSGKYVRFSLDNGPIFDAILRQTTDNSSPAGDQTLIFTGDGWQVTSTGPATGDILQFSFTPPTSQPAPKSGAYRRDRIGTPKPVSQAPPPGAATSVAVASPH